MINNGDAIGRLKALLHLRGAHDRSSSRERVAGDLFRLRGNMTDIRRARVSRQNLPRLQGARELMPAECSAFKAPLAGTVVWLSPTLREGTQDPASRETAQRLIPMRRNA